MVKDIMYEEIKK